jgi:hypothetical protein
MNRLRSKLTYANVVSTLCLFLLVGGSAAFAATQLPKNSVGSKQLKKNAVTPAKLSPSVKTTLSGGKGPEGPRGPQGPKGDKGEKGAPGSFPQALASGQTEKGSYGIASTRFDAGGGAFTPAAQVSYPIPLSFEPQPHIIESGGSSTPECPGDVGNPTAAPGHLCVYASREDVELSLENEPSEGRYGFLAFFNAEEGEDYEDYGTWAVTAP